VIADQSGAYSAIGGRGSTVAVRLAIEDFGGKVLGRPIEVVQADHQNKADLATSLSRQWIDNNKVVALIHGGGTSVVGFALKQLGKDKKIITLDSASTSTDLVGKACSPYGFQFAFDTYSMTKVPSASTVQRGENQWFFIAADYTFGKNIVKDATAFIDRAGGKVVGTVSAPLGSIDYSSFLLQAKSSKANAIGLALAGSDLVNVLKQASEFGMDDGKQKIVGFFVMINDVAALGLDKAQGMTISTSFYWDLNEQTRAWAKRFMAQYDGKVPSEVNAGAYSATLHMLRAMEAAKSTDPDLVAAKMREMRMNDMYNKDVLIREDGRALQDMYLMQIKAPAQSKYKYDFYQVLSRVPGNEAYGAQNPECPLVKTAAR
jgi:branched-chain amino acid transport system substrate-binding protein